MGSAFSYAGLWVETQASVISAGNLVGGVDTTDTRSVVSATLGYAFQQGFVVGAQALSFHSTSAAETAFGYGPKAGLLIKGFEVTAAYLIDTQDNVLGLNRAGSGFALNLGYTFHVSGPFRLGALYTYWQNTYNSQNAVATGTKYTQSYSIPQVAIAFEF